MSEDRKRRFWVRVLIAFLVCTALYFACVIYAAVQAGEAFKAGITD
jgi:hypothetical protein